jgi:hypothetical protein
MGFATEEPFFSAERDTASRSRHKKTNSSISRDVNKEREKVVSLSSASVSGDTTRLGLGLFTSTSSTDGVHDPLAGLSSLFANPVLLAATQQHAAAGRFSPLMFPWPPTTTHNGNSSSSSQHATHFDSLLSGFPVDPFLVPPASLPPFVQPFGPDPSSLLPLTIRGSDDASSRTPTSSGTTGGGIFAIDPALALAPVSASAPPAPAPTAATKTPASATAAPPPAKRQKTSAAAAARKKSAPTTESPTTTTMSPVDENKPAPTPVPAPPSRQMTPLTAAEDKRRRNTAASARFRAKKKEREAVMERTARDLEERMLELERECESLRKENGWLKGLVVGATTGDGVDLSGLEGMFNAFKAAAAATAPVPATLAKVGSKRKRTTA